MKPRDPTYALSRGVESLSKEEHGRFFDAMQLLGLRNEVKQAAVALYLDFKSRPIGEYNVDRKNLGIFLIASVSLAAKAMGEWRTDQEFESKMFVQREKLVDAEERILKSFGVQDSVIPFSELVDQLSRRQIESMAEDFARRGLIGIDEVKDLAQRSDDYLDLAVGRGLNPRMSYRGRAAGVMLKAVRDLGLRVSENDIAMAAGFDRKLMITIANVVSDLLNHPQSSG